MEPHRVHGILRPEHNCKQKTLQKVRKNGRLNIISEIFPPYSNVFIYIALVADLEEDKDSGSNVASLE